MLKGLERHSPEDWLKDFDTIGAPGDWCGLNYYIRKVSTSADSARPSLTGEPGSLTKTQMG